MNNLDSKFVFPQYPDKCFSSIPGTIFNFFGIKSKIPVLTPEFYESYMSNKYKNIVLLFIDGLGFLQWKKYANHYPLFNQLDHNNHLKRLTSIFPSTTAAALTTINCGATPAEHGLFEWYLYLEEIGQTIETIPFKALGQTETNSLLKDNVNPKVLLTLPTIYSRLKKYGITSYTFANKSYSNSVYSRLSRSGSVGVTYINFSDLAVKLRTQLVSATGKNYFFVYWDKLDTLGHEYGPSSDAYSAELNKISHLFLSEFVAKIPQKLKQKTLLIITADHGLIDIDYHKTIYLNRDKNVFATLQRNKQGDVILPTGSPREVFLHIKPERLEFIQNYLNRKLKHKAQVIRTDEAISLGLFCKNKIKDQYKKRLGNLILLCKENHTVWREHPSKPFKFLGHHGGLSPEEMLIPFAICRLEEMAS